MSQYAWPIVTVLQVYGVLQDNTWAIQLARVSGAVTALTSMLDSRERACRAVAAVSLRALCLNSAEACKVICLALPAPCAAVACSLWIAGRRRLSCLTSSRGGVQHAGIWGRDLCTALRCGTVGGVHSRL